MEKIALKRQSISQTLDQYEQRFGHIPSPEFLESMTVDELDERAAIALSLGEPVIEWEERPWVKYGNTNDVLFEERAGKNTEVIGDLTFNEAFVYVLRRVDSVQPVSKVGFTRKKAEGRAKDYTDGEWEVFFERRVPSLLGLAIERLAHQILTEDGHWLDPKLNNGVATEIFLCEAVIAVRAVSQAVTRTRAQLQDWLQPADPIAVTNLKAELSQLENSLRKEQQQAHRRTIQIDKLSERLSEEQRRSSGRLLAQKMVLELSEQLLDKENRDAELLAQNQFLHSQLELLNKLDLDASLRNYRKFFNNPPSKKKLDLFAVYYDEMLLKLEDLNSKDR
jgi:hypothetical protein